MLSVFSNTANPMYVLPWGVCLNLLTFKLFLPLDNKNCRISNTFNSALGSAYGSIEIAVYINIKITDFIPYKDVIHKSVNEFIFNK